MLMNWLRDLKKKGEYLNYGRHIVVDWALRYGEPGGKYVDVGCGACEGLLHLRRMLPKGTMIITLDHLAKYVRIARGYGFDAQLVDIEWQEFPCRAGSADLVTINQVLEHITNIRNVYAAMNRVLKIGGYAIIGVPNLASLHNRIGLLFGRQPTCIAVPGPHLRGFTLDAVKQMIDTWGGFEIVEVRGSNFYPFPPGIARMLADWFPGLAVGLFVLLRKTKSVWTGM